MISLFGRRIKAERVICIVLCVIALIGFWLPAINVDVHFWGSSRNITFSMASFFDEPDNPFGDLDTSESTQMDLLDMLSDVFDGISTKITISVIAYLITLLLLIVLLFFIIAGKMKKTMRALSIVSLVLLGYAGFTMSSVREPLITGIQSTLENELGFWAIFIDISNILTLSFGHGYWLSLAAIGAMALVGIISIAYELKTQ